MVDHPKLNKERTAQAVEQGRRSFLGDLAYWRIRARATPSPQDSAQKPAPEPPKAASPPAKPLPQAHPRAPASPQAYPRPIIGGRTTPPLPYGSAPREEPEERGPTIIPAEPKPSPAAFMNPPKSPDSIVDALFSATGDERPSLMISESHGVSRKALEQGTAPMEMGAFTEKSMVELKVDDLKAKVPPRFIPYIDSAMEVLKKNMKGYEGYIKALMLERRWTHQQEETLGGALSAASDEMQRIFARMYKQEAIQRVKSRQELKGLADPGEVEKLFAYAILGSKHPNANREVNIFDAFAKGAIFVFLSQQRPRTFMHALGHPEVSKPYGALGGVEGLGVMLGLDLPDPNTVNSVSNPLIGLAFRLYSEVHLCTLAGWLVSVSSKWPKPQTVGRFEHMVRQDVDEFQKAVSDTRFTAEMFFQVLAREDHSKLRSEKSLNAIFEEAAKGSGSIIYGNADDIFDALEAIIGYMNMLKHDRTARALFLESYLANYPLGMNGGTFYKMFGMSLFNEKEDLERHPEIVEAFQ
ncbi:MAG: hypothetical protein QXH30_00005, partial [Candidatus Bilamarchaeaceae archaeon]